MILKPKLLLNSNGLVHRNPIIQYDRSLDQNSPFRSNFYLLLYRYIISQSPLVPNRRRTMNSLSCNTDEYLFEQLERIESGKNKLEFLRDQFGKAQSISEPNGKDRIVNLIMNYVVSTLSLEGEDEISKDTDQKASFRMVEMISDRLQYLPFLQQVFSSLVQQLDEIDTILHPIFLHLLTQIRSKSPIGFSSLHWLIAEFGANLGKKSGENEVAKSFLRLENFIPSQGFTTAKSWEIVSALGPVFGYCEMFGGVGSLQTNGKATSWFGLDQIDLQTLDAHGLPSMPQTRQQGISSQDNIAFELFGRSSTPMLPTQDYQKREAHQILQQQRILNQSINQCVSKQYQIFMALIRSSKQSADQYRQIVFDYMFRLIELNKPRLKMQVFEWPQLSSESFLLNCMGVLLMACDPFIGGHMEKLDKVDWSVVEKSLSDSSQKSGENEDGLSKIRKMVLDEDLTRLCKSDQQTSQPSTKICKPNFITQLFFLTAHWQHISIHRLLTRYQELLRRLGELGRVEKQLKQQLGISGPGLVEDDADDEDPGNFGIYDPASSGNPVEEQILMNPTSSTNPSLLRARIMYRQLRLHREELMAHKFNIDAILSPEGSLNRLSLKVNGGLLSADGGLGGIERGVLARTFGFCGLMFRWLTKMISCNTVGSSLNASEFEKWLPTFAKGYLFRPKMAKLSKFPPSAYLNIPEFYVEDCLSLVSHCLKFWPDVSMMDPSKPHGIGAEMEQSSVIDGFCTMGIIMLVNWQSLEGDDVKTSGKNPSGLITNPYLVAKIVEIFHDLSRDYFDINRYRQIRGQYAPLPEQHPAFKLHLHMRRPLYLNPLLRQNLSSCLPKVYVLVERTGMSSQFYDKFGIRYNICRVFDAMWEVGRSKVGASMVSTAGSSSEIDSLLYTESCAYAQNFTSENSNSEFSLALRTPYTATLRKDYSHDTDLLVRFVNLLMNDLTYLLDEGLGNLMQIHDSENELASGNLEGQQQQESIRRLSELERSTSSYIHLANETLRQFQFLSASLPQPFLRPEIIDRLAAMMNYNLKQLVGPKCRNLKVKQPERFGFRPKNMLGLLVDVYRHLAGYVGDEFAHARPEKNINGAVGTSSVSETQEISSQSESSKKFVKSIAREGRSFDIKIFERTLEIIANRNIKPPGQVAEFSELIESLKSILKQDGKIPGENSSGTNDANVGQAGKSMEEDCPEEFLDPLMFTMMEDPVILPASKVTVDRSTIVAHLLSDTTDPFNRTPLSIDMVIENSDLKKKINQWKDARNI